MNRMSYLYKTSIWLKTINRNHFVFLILCYIWLAVQHTTSPTTDTLIIMWIYMCLTMCTCMCVCVCVCVCTHTVTTTDTSTIVWSIYGREREGEERKMGSGLIYMFLSSSSHPLLFRVWVTMNSVQLSTLDGNIHWQVEWIFMMVYSINIPWFTDSLDLLIYLHRYEFYVSSCKNTTNKQTNKQTT